MYRHFFVSRGDSLRWRKFWIFSFLYQSYYRALTKRLVSLNLYQSYYHALTKHLISLHALPILRGVFAPRLFHSFLLKKFFDRSKISKLNFIYLFYFLFYFSVGFKQVYHTVPNVQGEKMEELRIGKLADDAYCGRGHRGCDPWLHLKIPGTMVGARSHVHTISRWNFFEDAQVPYPTTHHIEYHQCHRQSWSQFIW